MKKRMKKLVAIAATAAMVASVPVSAVTTYAAGDDITIGVSIWSSTDVLGSQCKKIIDKAAALSLYNSNPYTDEEIVEMAGYSFDDLNKAATSLSIEDVLSRHSN